MKLWNKKTKNKKTSTPKQNRNNNKKAGELTLSPMSICHDYRHANSELYLMRDMTLGGQGDTGQGNLPRFKTLSGLKWNKLALDTDTYWSLLLERKRGGGEAWFRKLDTLYHRTDSVMSVSAVPTTKKQTLVMRIWLPPFRSRVKKIFRLFHKWKMCVPHVASKSKDAIKDKNREVHSRNEFHRTT